MNAWPARRLAGWGAALLVAALVIFWTGEWAGRREAGVQADAVHRAIEVHMLGLRGAASRYNYLPFAAAQHQDVLSVLTGPTDAGAQERANVYLENVSRRAGSDTLYVMALDGRLLTPTEN